MADTSMGVNKSNDHSQRDDGNQEDAFMIPGVDGRLQFGFPTKIITILRYFDQYTLTSTAGGVATNVFRMNSPFDPDLTGVGHQPLYWDKYAAIYQSYRVLGSRLTANISGSNLTAAQGPWWWGINGSTSSSSMGNFARNRSEQNDSISAMYNGQATPETLSFAYSPEIKLGRPAGDDTVGAFVSTNPTTQYYAHVWMTDMLGANSTAITRVGIEYTIEFHGLIQETES